jgi:hypothetical protein
MNTSTSKLPEANSSPATKTERTKPDWPMIREKCPWCGATPGMMDTIGPAQRFCNICARISLEGGY